MHRIALLLFAFLVVLGCRGRQPEQTLPPLPERPLAGLAAQRLILLPVHYLRPADTLGWAAAVQTPRELLRELDQKLSEQLEEAGLRGQWLFPDQLAQSARRNPTYMPDPYALAAQRLRPGSRPLPQGMITDPLASQLRALVAMHEEGRMVLFPVELRFEPAGEGGRATLRVVLVDARSLSIRWAGDVSGDPSPSNNPEVIASLARRFADLVAP